MSVFVAYLWPENRAFSPGQIGRLQAARNDAAELIGWHQRTIRYVDLGSGAAAAEGAHDGIMIETKGHNGQVQFDGEFVTIIRKGFLARSSVGKGDKRIHLSQITAVHWKPAGAMMNGFIRFTVPGGIEVRSGFGSRTASAAKDQNSVIFTRKQQPAFMELREAVESAMAARSQNSAPMSAGSVAEELAKLQVLVDQGVLSPEEFSQQKARLLG